MKNEYENIEHDKIANLRFLTLDVTYRRSHLHLDNEIDFVLDGQGTIEIHGESYDVKKGSILVVNPCELHSFKSDDNLRLLVMQYNANAFSSIYPSLDKIRFTEHIAHDPENSKFLSVFLKGAKSFYEEEREGRGQKALKSLGYDFLAIYELLKLIPNELFSSSQQNKLIDLQERIQRITSYISEHYLTGISLTTLAKEEKLSRTYFSHFFRNNFGSSFQEYIDNLRCEYSKHLLTQTKENMLSITYQSGFSDIRIYTNAFKRRYGLSPREFRKQFENNSVPKMSLADVEIMVSPDDVQTIYNEQESLKMIEAALDQNLSASTLL